MRSGPAVAPSYPSPAAAVTPAAAGTLRAFAGLLVGGAAVTVVLAAALIVSGGHSLTLGSGCAALLALGFACASTATIVAMAGGLRAPTLALVFAIATFWTAGGLPLWFAIPATLLTGLVLTADARVRGGARIGGRVPVAALAGAGAMLLVAAAATAQPRPAPRTATPAAAAALTKHVAPAKTPAAPAHTPAPTATPAHTPAPTATPAAPTATPAAPAATPAPATPSDATPAATAPATPSDAARPDPADFVRAYYAALDKHQFAAVWKLLSPAVQSRFGTFADWRAGYATTLANAPEKLAVTLAADGSATVRHALVARDRTKCGGTREQRFTVTWKLAPAGSGWTVASLAATVAGPAAKSSPCP